VRSVFRELQTQSRMYLDQSQQPWLEVTREGEVQRVGLSASNILDAQSDRRLAMQVLLARMSALLSANGKHREPWADFQNDWALLEAAEGAGAAPNGRVVATTAGEQ